LQLLQIIYFQNIGFLPASAKLAVKYKYRPYGYLTPKVQLNHFFT